MKQQAFGLDLGATKMKAVYLQKQKNGYSFRSAIMGPTPIKGMSSDSPLDQEEMGQAIKKLLSDAKIDSKEVNIAFPENQIYTKVIEMPYLNDHELDQAIYYEAEQYIPVPLSGITLAHAILKKPEKKEEGSKVEILLIGAPTVLIERHKKILGLAGLTIASIETEILSSIRALIPSSNIPPTLIVNIGAVSTTIAIVRTGIIVFSYSTPTGGSAISRAIASDYGFSLAQAEEYKKAYGITNQSVGNKLGKTTEPIIQSILSEIKKAVAFYAEKFKGDDVIRQILLTGGTAKLPGIEAYFAQNTDIETAIANPWKNVVAQNIPKELQDNAVDYTIAIGLAMRTNG